MHKVKAKRNFLAFLTLTMRKTCLLRIVFGRQKKDTPLNLMKAKSVFPKQI